VTDFDVVVDHGVPNETTRQPATIRRSPMTVGPVSDAAERHADDVADSVVRALTGGAQARASSSGATSSEHRLRRSPAFAGSAVIRRKIGNDGDKNKGRKIRQVSNPKRIGTILGSSTGGGLWTVTWAVGATNLEYQVDFGGGVVEKISGGNADYELVPEGSADAPQVQPTSSSSAKADAEAQQKREAALKQLNDLLDGLGQPLLGLAGANGADHGPRKALVQQLRKELKTATDKPAGPVPDDERLKEYAARVASVESAFRQQAKAAADKADEKRKADKDAEDLAKQAAATRKQQEAVEGANRTRVGNPVLYSQLAARAEPDQLAQLLAPTPLGEEGALLNCLRHDVDAVVALLGKKITPKTLNTLLGKTTERSTEQLTVLLDHVGGTASERDHLGNLLDRTAPDKATLVKLLVKVDKSAARAWKLMSAASKGSEASVLAMLDAGRKEADVPKLVNTAAGRTDTADAATVSAGVADSDTARTLLEQPGVSGSANEAVDVLAHQAVGGDIAVATRLLNKPGKGNAADALALLNHGCSLDDAEQLLDTTGIRGAGADAVWCLQRGCSVADLVTLLDARTATELRTYHDNGHSFGNIQNKIAAYAQQRFWAGETCPAPACEPAATALQHIIDNARHPPAVGDYSGRNPFGNHGGPDTMVLPDTGHGIYREYDLKPYVDAPSRGKRRMVEGHGHRYYTDDHYLTFKRFA